jgi:hypothetical protein
MRFVQAVGERLFCLLLFFLFSQLPLYVNEYLIRLEGHLAESNRQIAKFQDVAALSNKTLEQYIAKFFAQSDKDFRRHGELMKEAVRRNQFLTQAVSDIKDANPLLRPFYFVRYFERKVALDALHEFYFGFVFSWDVILWGLMGWILGWILFILFASPRRAFIEIPKK